MADSKLSALSEVSVPALADFLYEIDAGPNSLKVSASRLFGQLNHVCQGRLTLTSGTAVTTSDVTGATSVYFTPYNGQCVALYDGTRWRMYTFTELTLALGTLTSGLPYDVFLYDNAGTLTLELLAWTNGTTRATALALQNGVYCKTGALTRRYLGTFYTTSTTTTEDSLLKRDLWNLYNQKPRRLAFDESTSHTYDGGYRYWNNSAASRVEFVVGLSEQAIAATLLFEANSSTSNRYPTCSINLDVNNASDAYAYGQTTTGGLGYSLTAGASYLPAVGWHYMAVVEGSFSSGSVTFTDCHLRSIIQG